MAFWGSSFSFNGIPCEDFELMMYSIDGTTHSAGKFASGVSIIEQKIATRWKPYFYGTQLKDKLSFSIVFGVNEERINKHEFLLRDELEKVAAWLSGHNEYMWLEIYQEDMEYIRYHCIVTELEIVEFDLIPWALKATFECDSPYAYMQPQTYEYDINGSADIVFYNESSHNGYYMPIIEFDLTGSQSFSLMNRTDNNRLFSFTDLPASITNVCIDNDHGIITTNDDGLNPYPYFNFHFFRLLRGENHLTITGNGTLRIICEFPVNAGG